MIAKHKGVCPLCDRYIVPGRSVIERLPFPIPPVSDELIPDKDHQEQTYADHRTTAGHARPWVHRKCLDRYEEELLHRERCKVMHPSQS